MRLVYSEERAMVLQNPVGGLGGKWGCEPPPHRNPTCGFGYLGRYIRCIHKRVHANNGIYVHVNNSFPPVIVLEGTI